MLLLLLLASASAFELPGDLAAVPPMGWNSWNCFGGSVSEADLREQAEAMVSFGLRDAGWVYLVVDDGWQGERGGDYGAIQGNEKFPDLAGAFAAIRALGLRPGIYSTPWERSYQGRLGTDGHEVEDAAQWAAWGVRYLKYDWRPVDVASATRMHEALAMSGAPVVFSLSNNLPTPLAPTWASVANLWRTTGDITDSWQSMAGIGFSQAGLEGYAGPGGWNDPDMLVLGWLGWGAEQHLTQLTPDEQRTHISLWALLAAPLMLGCDMTRLDEATLALLTHERLLEISQDPAGLQGSQVLADGAIQVWTRPLSGGDLAVGVFNLGEERASTTLRWEDLGLGMSEPVRELWEDQDLGTLDQGIDLEIAPHGVALLAVGARVPVPPVLIGPLEERGLAGEPFGLTVLTAGDRPVLLAAEGLPEGLTLEGRTILGTPEEAGRYEVALSAENAGGTTEGTLVLDVAEPAANDDAALLWLAASELSVPPGQEATLSWATLRAEAVTLEPGIGAVEPSGTLAIRPEATTSYALTVEGPGGPLVRELRIEVPTGPVLLGLACPGRLRPVNDAAEWQGWGEAREDYSVGTRPLSVGGQPFLHGIGTHAASRLEYPLEGRYLAFSASAGVDDEVREAGLSLSFAVYLDDAGEPAWESGPLRAGDPALPVALDVAGAQRLVLAVDDGGDGLDYDHADWLEPVLWPLMDAEDDTASADSEPPCAEPDPGDEGCGGCSAAPAGALLTGWLPIALARRRRRA